MTPDEYREAARRAWRERHRDGDSGRAGHPGALDMTRLRSYRAVSMDTLAERCFQLDANTQMRRLKEKLPLARAPGNDTRRLGAAGCLLSSLIALVLIIVLTANGVPFVVAFLLIIVVAALVYRHRVVTMMMDRTLGRPVVRPWKTSVQLWKTLVQLWTIRASVKQGIAAYARSEPWAVARVHEYAVEEFRNRVAEHREQTLGDSSEWSRARASLMQAASEAQRSAAYWRARLRQEPSNEFAKSQKDVSDRLQAKLDTAFEKLEARSVALRRFYNECDARLAAMDRRNRDLEEFRRLEELSGRADMIIAHAEGIIESFAIAFAAEARAFADTLRGVATVSIKALAGEAPMDNIDYFADRIIEDSDRDRVAIEDLERRLAP